MPEVLIAGATIFNEPKTVRQFSCNSSSFLQFFNGKIQKQLRSGIIMPSLFSDKSRVDRFMDLWPDTQLQEKVTS